jgi:hypothetical protein
VHRSFPPVTHVNEECSVRRSSILAQLQLRRQQTSWYVTPLSRWLASCSVHSQSRMTLWRTSQLTMTLLFLYASPATASTPPRHVETTPTVHSVSSSQTSNSPRTARLWLSRAHSRPQVRLASYTL